MKKIDLATWPRAEAYALYRPYAMPHMALSVELDVSELWIDCRAKKRSFFAAMMHRLITAANGVPSLRQRFGADYDSIIEHEQVDPAFTVAVEGGLFNFATVPLQADVALFADEVARMSAGKRTVRTLEPFEGIRSDVIYMSCLPWMNFSSLTHPVSSADDCVPRIAWGRVVTRGENSFLTVNIQVHHALVDGSHLGAFFTALA